MYYHEPENFEDFVYLGLVIQGNGMKSLLRQSPR